MGMLLDDLWEVSSSITGVPFNLSGDMQEPNGDKGNHKNLNFSPNDARDSVCSLHCVDKSTFLMGNDCKSKVNNENRKDSRQMSDDMPMLKDIKQEGSPKTLHDAYLLANLQEATIEVIKKSSNSKIPLSSSSKINNSKAGPDINKCSLCNGIGPQFSKGLKFLNLNVSALNELEEDCNIEEIESNGANGVADITSGLIGGGDLCKEDGKDNLLEK
ncbi:hypothetical protein Tco_1517384 [Tanacetum coccineum]